MEQINQVIVQAPGKVNLYLDILGTDHRNYHLLNTILQSISLEDTVTIEKTKQEKIDLGTTWSHIPDGEENIAHKAATAFFKYTGIPQEGLFIHIDKVIPDQAGLGGGSSDAAAVLVGLNKMYGSRLSEEELRDIGVKIGADVPFCILGGCALAEGIGEILTPLLPLPPCHLVLVKPMVGVETVEAFSLYDTLKRKLQVPPLTEVLAAFRSGNLGKIACCMSNVFAHVLEELPTKRITKQLLAAGALGATLSGSGSAVVGIFEDKKKAESCYRRLRQGTDMVYFATPVSHGAKIR